jgi:hypothetical protein
MYPTVRNPGSDAFDVRITSSPANSSWPKYFLLAILWIVAALFLLATTGAPAQALPESMLLIPPTGTMAGNGVFRSGSGAGAGSQPIVHAIRIPQ